MPRVNIAVSPRPYEAIIERGLLDRAGAVLRDFFPDPRPLFIVTVSPVRRRWGAKLLRSLSAGGFRAKIVEMPDGEPHKKLPTLQALAEKLVALGANRDSVIVGFGGGIVGDVAGLLASLYMRGIDFIQFPTTVLAQVDASIGGKTGVNLKAGKNLLGTFHQPLTVLIDPDVLSTLPDREFRAGLYESLKCGVIGNAELFSTLERTRWKTLRRDPETLEYVISESVKLKAKIVSADERECDLRRVLNFGHTIGHALEAQSRYRRFLHGEAIAWGMIAAADIAYEMHLCSSDTSERIIEAVVRSGALPPVSAPSQDILRFLQTDKKTRNGAVHFVLPREIGKVEIVNGVSESLVIDAVDRLRTFSRRS
jgi:3-dehydroquinate synthase